MPTTTHYGWTMPTPGGDTNAWGTILNNALQAVDTEIARSREFNVLRDGADPTGATDSRPAFLAALARVATAGGGVLKVPPGIFRLGDGYSEPGSFLGLNVDRLVFDARGARIVGNVIVGDLSNPSICPRDVTVLGGVYAPDTSAAPPYGGRYFSYSNACGIASGVGVKFIGVTCEAGPYVRGFSIQTNSTYTGNGGVPIQGVTVLGLVIRCNDSPDGLDISCEGADGLIRDVVVQGLSTGTPRRAVNCSAGGSAWRIQNLSLDWVVDGSVDVAAQFFYLRDARVRLLASNVGWAGVNVNASEHCDFDLDVAAAASQDPAQPPVGSGLAVNTNCGCAFSGASTDPVSVRLRTRGPFYNGLLPAKNGAHYSGLCIEGCSGRAIVSDNYTHTFGTVRLLNVGTPPVFGGTGEVYDDVRQYSATSGVWHGINPVVDFGAGTALVWHSENRSNNSGVVARLRAAALGSGIGGFALDVGAGGGGTVSGLIAGQHDGAGAKLGFFSATPAARPVVTGSRGGNASLQSLLTGLAALGLITDNTTA